MEKTDENYVFEDIITEAEEAPMQILPGKCLRLGVQNVWVLDEFTEDERYRLKCSIGLFFPFVKNSPIVTMEQKSDILKYSKLTSFLKRKSQAYKLKKLEGREIEKFLNKAVDNEYLLMKMALITGISIDCRWIGQFEKRKYSRQRKVFSRSFARHKNFHHTWRWISSQPDQIV